MHGYKWPINCTRTRRPWVRPRAMIVAICASHEPEPCLLIYAAALGEWTVQEGATNNIIVVKAFIQSSPNQIMSRRSVLPASAYSALCATTHPTLSVDTQNYSSHVWGQSTPLHILAITVTITLSARNAPRHRVGDTIRTSVC